MDQWRTCARSRCVDSRRRWIRLGKVRSRSEGRKAETNLLSIDQASFWVKFMVRFLRTPCYCQSNVGDLRVAKSFSEANEAWSDGAGF